jgi:hypothetical protein
MSNFQILIVSGTKDKDSLPAPSEQREKFEVRPQSKGMERVLDDIDSLGQVWHPVVQKLSSLASKTAAVSGQYEMKEIEFNIGIEAGLSIGLVSKGNASVIVKFSKTA